MKKGNNREKHSKLGTRAQVTTQKQAKNGDEETSNEIWIVDIHENGTRQSKRIQTQGHSAMMKYQAFHSRNRKENDMNNKEKV